MAARTTLSTVVKMAYENEKFWTGLVEDPEKALKKARISLSQNQFSKLNSILKSSDQIKNFEKYRAVGKMMDLRYGYIRVIWSDPPIELKNKVQNIEKYFRKIFEP